MMQRLIDIKRFLNSKLNAVVVFFMLFYTIGVIGILIPTTREIYISLVPFALLLSITGLLVFHQSTLNSKALWMFGLVYVLGLLIEILGVNTKVVFGSYFYGKTLGVKFLQTPLIIGLNWLMLVYCATSVVGKFNVPMALKIFLASALLVIYDVILEQVAPIIDMWHWTGGIVPLQNYIAWFLVAIVLTSVLFISRIKLNNPLAIIIVSGQFLFFTTLAIFL